MSLYTDLAEIVHDISENAKSSSVEILQYAKTLDRFNESFSSLVKGTKDPSANKVSASFRGAQKELYNASKLLILASKAGDDWCEKSSPDLVVKKLKR